MVCFYDITTQTYYVDGMPFNSFLEAKAYIDDLFHTESEMQSEA